MELPWTEIWGAEEGPEEPKAYCLDVDDNKRQMNIAEIQNLPLFEPLNAPGFFTKLFLILL
jgi:hypothetical protein